MRQAIDPNLAQLPLNRSVTRASRDATSQKSSPTRVAASEAGEPPSWGRRACALEVRMRKAILAFVLVMAAFFSLQTPPVLAGAPPVIGVLKAGSFVFWNGGQVGATTDRVASMPAAISPSCP